MSRAMDAPATAAQKSKGGLYQFSSDHRHDPATDPDHATTVRIEARAKTQQGRSLHRNPLLDTQVERPPSQERVF